MHGKKNMEIQSGAGKMRNASGQQGENKRQSKIKGNMSTGNKILLGKQCDVLVIQNSVVVVKKKNGKGKTKTRAAHANLFFAN